MSTSLSQTPVSAPLKPHKSFKRRFTEWVYKPLINPLFRLIAGRRWSPWGVVHHVGRSSGRSYRTPVLPSRVEGGFVIPLPFGPDADWARNITAADHFTLTWRSVDYKLQHPLVVERREILPLLAPAKRIAARLTPVRRYLKVAEIG